MEITFIIPAYQAERTVARTIESILNQTDQRYRIIIVNDGSSDGTERICKDYAAQHPEKITYIYQDNRGLGGARNRGMELAATEYVSFLDSDDWLMPEYVECLLGYAEKNRAEMIMILPVIYHEGSRITRDWYDRVLFEQIFDYSGKIINPELYPKVYQLEVNQCRKILHRDFIRRVNFSFREQIKWEDVFPHFYLLSQCKACMGIKEVGFYYRIGSTGQITSQRGRERLDILTVFTDLLDYVSEERRSDLEFASMRVIVRFSIWCIRMSEKGIRQELVRELNAFFRKIPKRFYQALKQGTRAGYSKADARQYQLFVTAIRIRPLSWIFYDYFYQDVGEKMIKGLLKAKERVA